MTNYDSNFKKMIVDLHKTGEKISKISREYGVSAPTIRKWSKEYKNLNPNDEEDAAFIKEHKRLKRENARLKEENEVLKKCVGIFSEK